MSGVAGVAEVAGVSILANAPFVQQAHGCPRSLGLISRISCVLPTFFRTRWFVSTSVSMASSRRSRSRSRFGPRRRTSLGATSLSWASSHSSSTLASAKDLRHIDRTDDPFGFVQVP